MTPPDECKPVQDSMPIMKRLKEETAAYHAKLESLPFFKMLMEHRLPLECYVNQLRALSIIHGVLESEMAGEKAVAVFWDDSLRKLPLLEKDLAYFQPRVLLDARGPVAAALAVTEKIRLRRVEKPITLLGCLYVFEGSILGNRMHQADIAANFHLEGVNGCRYYFSYGDQVGARWREFSQKINDTLGDSADHGDIVAAADETFAGLETLYRALYPLEKSAQSFHITRINPEAGNHPMPQDEREIGAALRASAQGWNEFGYYLQRYGQRGKRFSDSDTCWLATLAALEPAIVRQQIDWLCRVLASRGMPTIMMEYSLRFLSAELAKVVPEKQASYQKLVDAADSLRAAREKIVASSDLQSLSAEFDQAIPDDMAQDYRNTGKLLVAAVADEKGGIKGSVAALQGWLTDPQRFSGGWIGAVTSILQKAQRIVAAGSDQVSEPGE